MSDDTTPLLSIRISHLESDTRQLVSMNEILIQ